MPRSPAHPSGEIPDIRSLLAEGGRLSEILNEYEYREEQVTAALAVEEALISGRNCLMEAGTGVGKTLAYLLPAVRMIAAGKRVVISTHTISLQGQLVEKDIPLVRSLLPQVDVRVALLKGRNNYLCLQDLEMAAADVFHAGDPIFEKVRRWQKHTRTGDVAELGFTYPRWNEIAANPDTCRARECRLYEECFYFRARKAALASNLIVVNHALYLSDLAIRAEDPQSGILPEHSAVVLDEAHHLEDVAGNVFGTELPDWRLAGLSDRLKRVRDCEIDQDNIAAVEDLNISLFTAISSPRQEFFLDEALTDAREEHAAAGKKLFETLGAIALQLREGQKDADEEPAQRIEGIARITERQREELGRILFAEDPDYIRWGSKERTSTSSRSRHRRTQDRLTLHYTPVNVARILKQLLWCHSMSVVLTSATLSNSGGFTYLRSRLGAPEDAMEEVIGSPFDYPNQALLYVPIDLPEPPKTPDEGYTAQVADEIERLVRLTNGRAFLLFTSRRNLDLTYNLLKERLPFPLFRQGDQPPTRLLESFKTSGDGVLFGLQTFWEGVDVQGDALSMVVIDRIPFSVPDAPVMLARTRAVEEAGGNSFADLSIPQAQLRLKQGFGRLIRTRNDRGIVCILDKRMMSKRYGKEFIQFLPPARRASLWQRVEAFWHGEGNP